MNKYRQLADAYARLAQAGKRLPVGSAKPHPRPPIPAGAPRVLLFSPHPDDEVLAGALALRLLRQSRWQVINVAVTQGSNRQRQAVRLRELKACCRCLGFGLVQTAPRGLEQVNVSTRRAQPRRWQQSVRVLAGILARQQPRVIFCPHASDWNSTHIGTHYLVQDALGGLPAGFSCYVVETEYWRAMAAPNLMVEVSPADLGDLMTALAMHAGEVRRNPYHVSLPAWMMDNVRRGAELIGGQGGRAPDFQFAVLYRVRRWAGGKLVTPQGLPASLPAARKPGRLFV